VALSMGATMTTGSSGIGLLLSSCAGAYRAWSALVASSIAASWTALMSTRRRDCCAILSCSSCIWRQERACPAVLLVRLSANVLAPPSRGEQEPGLPIDSGAGLDFYFWT